MSVIQLDVRLLFRLTSFQSSTIPQSNQSVSTCKVDKLQRRRNACDAILVGTNDVFAEESLASLNINELETCYHAISPSRS